LYQKVLVNLMQSLKPRDFLEQCYIRDVAVATWDIIRYSRHKALAVERRYRQRIEFQARKAEEAQHRKDILRKQMAENGGRATTDAQRALELLDKIESSVDDVDKILKGTPTEIDDDRALEESIQYYGVLDKLQREASQTRKDALEQLEWYRTGLGKAGERVSDEIIDAEFTVADQGGLDQPNLDQPSSDQPSSDKAGSGEPAELPIQVP
jgi:hypothetical protein